VLKASGQFDLGAGQGSISAPIIVIIGAESNPALAREKRNSTIIDEIIPA
jgi:hypothetical protein